MADWTKEVYDFVNKHLVNSNGTTRIKWKELVIHEDNPVITELYTNPTKKKAFNDKINRIKKEMFKIPTKPQTNIPIEWPQETIDKLKEVVHSDNIRSEISSIPELQNYNEKTLYKKIAEIKENPEQKHDLISEIKTNLKKAHESQVEGIEDVIKGVMDNLKLVNVILHDALNPVEQVLDIKQIFSAEPALSEHTIKDYYSFLKDFTLDELKDVENMISIIESRKNKKTGEDISFETKGKNIKAVQSLMKRLGYVSVEEKYKNIREKYQEVISKKAPIPIDITLSDFKKTIMTLKEVDTTAFTALYLQSEYPMRADFRDIKIANYDPLVDNHITSIGELVFHTRTKKTDGFKTMIPQDKMIHIKEYIQNKIDSGETYLFSSRSKEPYEHYSDFIKKCFTKNNLKPYTINNIRHMADTEFFGNIPSKEERDEQEKIMGHSMTASLRHYVS
jgi:hypothetical protein